MNDAAVETAYEACAERKRIEQSLKESESKYRKLFEEALDAIFVADAETGIVVDCNRAATELTSWSKYELVGMHQRRLHPPDEIMGEFSVTFEKHRKSGGGVVLDDRIVTRNGEIRDVAIKATQVEINGKRMLQGIFRDVTERKRNYERLSFQASLLNSVGQAVIATDMN